MERAIELITKCAHPDYKDQLLDYVKTAKLRYPENPEPHLFDCAFKMHVNLMKNGTMKMVSW